MIFSSFVLGMFIAWFFGEAIEDFLDYLVDLIDSMIDSIRNRRK